MSQGVGTSRGRLRREDFPARRDAVLDAAAMELVESGYAATTMLGIARRAGASKETIYNWFDSKEGLFAALVERNAERTNARVQEGLLQSQNPEVVLLRIAEELLMLLLSDGALAINRAAMQSPPLAKVLLEYGRFRTGALVERYLQDLIDRSYLPSNNPDTLFRLFYGLVVEDRQIRALLGDRLADSSQLTRHARDATARFLRLAMHPQDLAGDSGLR